MLRRLALKKSIKKYFNGFTLVEILIVVVIVGILAAIAIPTYYSYVRKGYATEAKTQMKNNEHKLGHESDTMDDALYANALSSRKFSKSIGAKADMGGIYVTHCRPAGSNKTRATNRQKKRRRK